MALTSLQIKIRQPDDWHLHLRDGNILKALVPHTARVFARAIVMPNLNPPITTVEAAQNYKQRILNSIPNGSNFMPLMTAYLTDELSRDVLNYGHSIGLFTAAKLYPANSTTNSAEGVRDLRNISPLLETMETIGMPLLIHGEVTDPAIDVFDREAIFIDRHLKSILASYPNLRIVLEHITTQEAVDFVESNGPNLAATITPHHLQINRNAMFDGGFRSDFYCLPVAKRERHRLALRRAATSGKSCYFLGTDSAPHLRSAKLSSCGCAGIFNSSYALETYAEVFEEEDSLNKLEAFSSEFGPAFYGLPLNEGSIKLVKKDQIVPNYVDLGEAEGLSQKVVPFHAGDRLKWSVFNG